MTSKPPASSGGSTNLPDEVVQILHDLNPWWVGGKLRKLVPPYQRRGVPELLARALRPQGLIEVIRGPRQVGKTTAIEQIIEHLLGQGVPPRHLLFVRFDQEVLRSVIGGLVQIVRWYEAKLRQSPFQKGALTDLGARNAVFRGAPSLWESSPEHVGPLIETLAQSVIRGPNLQVHFFRDYENPKNRMSTIREVDFVPENLQGQVIPIEIKFRRTIHESDFSGLNTFIKRFKPKYGIMVTREIYEWREEFRVLCVPLMEFLLAF